jgi:hypothetical protein
MRQPDLIDLLSTSHCFARAFNHGARFTTIASLAELSGQARRKGAGQSTQARGKYANAGCEGEIYSRWRVRHGLCSSSNHQASR